ncbi:MAG TPA: serine/threonine-protein kinase [Polyangiaceae bacterium]|nr:serine/threonine-protein kinase [Polyangiaceae bacterium]
MSQNEKSEQPPQPVYVIETIPVAGANDVPPEEIAAESIPTPANLRIFRELGRGGMGRIHPATDRNLLRHVALKRLDKDLAVEPFYRDGFIAEAQIAGQLEHPNIVPVHELAIDHNGIPYFTMKLVQGINLDRWLRSSRRSPGSTERLEEGLEILLKVCDAVAYAHHRGVIHRDLKPENIMVAGFGQVYLMDWGLAKLTRTRPASGSNAQMEAPGAVGTPEYMAPEQARGNPAEMDERSDVFGLGAVLYEIVSGKRPYGDHRDSNVILERAQAGKVVPIDDAAMGIGVSKRIRGVVAKATAADPKDRYQTVIELQTEIHNFLLGGLHLPRKLFSPGTLIVKEGDAGDAAYMIVSGRCRAYRTVGGQQETLGVMEAGDVFGEMALLLDEPRAASVDAVDSVTVLVLDKATMTEGLGTEGWTGALVRAIAQRFRDLELQVRSSGLRRSTPA